MLSQETDISLFASVRKTSSRCSGIDHGHIIIGLWFLSDGRQIPPPPDYLRYMELWIRIQHIPMKFFTGDTMYRLASEIGHVEEIAYDPKVSHTKDYIRALITFNTENPAKSTRKLTVSKDKTVTIEFEYERIHKKCHHYYRLTHEKFRCPVLRHGSKQLAQSSASPSTNDKSPSESSSRIEKSAPMEVPLVSLRCSRSSLPKSKEWLCSISLILMTRRDMPE